MNPFLSHFTRLAALSLAWCGACTTIETGDQEWYKEGATDRERAAALSTAEAQASQAGPAATEQIRKDIVIKNMTAQGWRLQPKKSAR